MPTKEYNSSRAARHARGCFAITPSDVTDFNTLTTCGFMSDSGGDVVAVFEDDTTATLTVLAGVLYPFCLKRIDSTSTTATGLTGFY